MTKTLMGQKVPLTDRCCGDSGSFAYSRPDIATQVKFRKQQDIEQQAEKLRADGFKGDVKILTLGCELVMNLDKPLGFAFDSNGIWGVVSTLGVSL